MCGYCRTHPNTRREAAALITSQLRQWPEDLQRRDRRWRRRSAEVAEGGVCSRAADPPACWAQAVHSRLLSGNCASSSGSSGLKAGRRGVISHLEVAADQPAEEAGRVLCMHAAIKALLVELVLTWEIGSRPFAESANEPASGSLAGA